MEKVYTGKLTYKSNGEDDEILGFVGERDFLADRINSDLEYGRYLYARYYISDEELEKDELKEEFLKTIWGIGEADYGVAYSEITGYLWTDEEIKIGGHDLLTELKSHIGKYLYLEIDFRKKPKP